MSRRRAQRLDAPMEHVGAQEFNEVNPAQGANGDASGILLFGSSPVPSWAQAVTFFVMEALLVGARGAIVALVAWLTYPPASTTTEWAFAIGIASAGTLYIATRTRQDAQYKRYINPIFVVGALFTRGIGLLGLLLYVVAHFGLGAFFGGAVLVRSLVGASLGTSAPAYPRAYFPIPTTTGTSLVTTVLLEIFVSCFLVLVQLIQQHMGTDSKNDMKNYRNSMKHTSMWVFGVTVIGVFFQSWLYDPSLYLTAAFGGINPLVTPPGGAYYLDIQNMTRLNSAVYPNSVFGNQNGAGALYVLGPLAGAIIGSLLFYVFWLIYFGQGDNDTTGYRNRIRSEKTRDSLDIQSSNQKSVLDDDVVSSKFE